MPSTVLPSACRRAVPTWPMDPAASPAEAAMWQRLWKHPIAEHWHVIGTAPDVVARYVRLAVNKPMSPTLTSMESQLALTPLAMARLHLVVGDVEAAAPVDFDVIERVRKRRQDLS